MALAAILGGLAAVALLWKISLIAFFAVLVVACRDRGTALQSVIGASGAWLGSSASLGPRPQVVSFIFCAITVMMWLRTASDLKARWWLVPLTWIWACSHGMWILGPLIGAVVILGLLLDGHGFASLRKMMLVPALSVLVAAATPVGPQLLLAPLSVRQYAPFVSEWAPANLVSIHMGTTIGMLVLVAVIWVRKGTPNSWTRVLLWCMALGWTLLYARTVAVGAVLTSPLFVEVLRSINLSNGSPQLSRPTRGESATLMASASVAAALSFVSLLSPLPPTTMPSAFNADLSKLPHKHRDF